MRRSSSRATDALTTEPITLPVVAASTAATPIAPVTVLPQRRDTAAGPVDSPTGHSAGLESDSESDSPKTPASLTPSAARSQLRAAKRARKRYEREEVRRFTWRTRRRKRTWWVVLSAFALLVAFVLVGAYSPVMALRTIDVVGTSRIPAEEVQKALSGQIGTPLPIVDFDRIKNELSSFTLIQSYATESRPPNTLVVRIVEREPVGLLQTAGGFDLVDAAGVVLASSADRPEGFPVVNATKGPGHAGFTAAAAVIRTLPENIRTQLDTVTAATADDVTLTLAGGARVVWGSAEQSEYKAVVLAALMVSYPPGSVGEYDVTSPDSAVLR